MKGVCITILTLLTVWWAQPALANDVTVTTTGTECFVRSERDNIERIWLRTPSCHITINNSSTAAVTVHLRLGNLDPDAVTINSDTDPAVVINRHEHRVRLTVTVIPGSKDIAIVPWYQYNDDWYFVALSDNQALGTIESNPIFSEFINDINVVNPVFMTNSGDLISSSALPSEINAAYTSVSEALSYSNVPMYAVPGNHDQITTTDDYVNTFGRGDYFFNYADARFVGLSTAGSTARGTISADQLSWLHDTLANPPNHQIVLFHHPLTPPTWAKPTCCFEDNSERDALINTLNALGVDLTINGHSQGFDLNTSANSFTQLITGGTGGQIAQPNGDHHFTLVHVTPDGFDPIEYVKGRFNTGVDYTNNSGNATQASAYVVNSGQIDLPYLRLKFKVESNHSAMVVADQTGAIINTVHTEQLNDYQVVYVDTSAPAGSSVTAMATVVDYANASGTVMIQPTHWETTGSYEHDWIETVSSSTSPTSYTLYNLPTNRLFTVTVNDVVVGTVLTTTDGELTLSVNSASLERAVRLQLRPEILPRTIVTASLDGDQAMVQSSDVSGQKMASWNVADPINRLTWLALDPTQPPYVLITHSNSTATIASLHTSTGQAVTEVSLPLITNQDQLELATGDINGDGQQELLSWTSSNHRQLSLRQFDYSTNAFSTLANITLPKSTTMVKGVLGDITADGIGDIILVVQRTHHTELRLYRYQSGVVSLVTKRRLTGIGNYYAVALGYVTQARQLELIIASRHRLTIYSQTDHELDLIKRVTWSKSLHGPLELMAAPVHNSGLDTIVLVSAADPVAVVYRDSQLKILYPFGRSYQGGLTANYVLNQTSDQFSTVVFGQPSGTSVAVGTVDPVVLY